MVGTTEVKETIFKRGCIYLAELPDGKGSVQKGKRPVVIIQNNMGNTYSPNVIVCTMTSKVGKRNLPTHVQLNENDGVKVCSDVQAEQIFTLSKDSLSSYCLGELNKETMKRVDRALKVSLSLNVEQEDSIINDLAAMIKSKKAPKSTLIDLLHRLCNIVGEDVDKFENKATAIP